MKRLLFLIVAILSIGIISSCGQSPVGSYSCVDPLDGRTPTVITLNANGSATMASQGEEVYHTYWDYAGKNIDVRIHTEVGTWIFMDFDEHRIYWGSSNYRSSTDGYIFVKR